MDKTKTIAPKRPTALPEKIDQEQEVQEQKQEEKKIVEEAIPMVEETNLPSATTIAEDGKGSTEEIVEESTVKKQEVQEQEKIEEEL